MSADRARRQRRLKRTWLVLSGLAADEPSLASTSRQVEQQRRGRPQHITAHDVETSLAPIEDSEWVARACLECVRLWAQQNVQARGGDASGLGKVTAATALRIDSVDALEAIIEQGIHRTDAAASRALEQVDVDATHESDRGSKERLLLWMGVKQGAADAGTLELRRSLIRFRRAMQVWRKLTDAETSQPPDDVDAWDQRDPILAGEGGKRHGRGAQSSQARLSRLADALLHPPSRIAADMASQAEFDSLFAYLDALDSTSFGAVAKQHRGLVRLALHAAAAHPDAEAILTEFEARGLLPGVDGETGEETGVWILRSAGATASPGADVVERPGVATALDSLFRPGNDLTEGQTRPDGAVALDKWYETTLHALANTTGQLNFVAMLAHLCVHRLGFEASTRIQALAEDAANLARLRCECETPTATAPSRWSLKEFSMHCAEREGVLELARSYLVGARGLSQARANVERGLAPILRTRRARRATPESELDAAIANSDDVDDVAELGLALIGETPRPGEAIHARVMAIAALVSADPSTSGLEVGGDGSIRLALSAFYSVGEVRQTSWLPVLDALLGVAQDDALPNEVTDLQAYTSVKHAVPTFGAPSPRAFFEALRPLRSQEVEGVLCLAQNHAAVQRLFAARGVPLSAAHLARIAGELTQQRQMVTRLLRAAAASLPSASSSGAPSGPLASWLTLFDGVVGVSGEGRALNEVSEKDVVNEFLGAALRSGELRTFAALRSQLPSLPDDEVEALVLDVSREFYDNATQGNLHFGEMKLAYECLSSIPTTPATRRERHFIEASSRLCSYRIPSKMPGAAANGATLSPMEIRLAPDRLELVARLLASQERSYATPDLILDLALKLNEGAVPSEAGAQQMKATSVCGKSSRSGDSGGDGGTRTSRSKAVVEARALAMLADAALAVEDFGASAQLCERLVDRAASAARKLRYAVEKAEELRQQDQGPAESAAIDVDADPAVEAARKDSGEVRELAWKACYQLAKHPGWSHDVEARLDVMAHVVALCPRERLSAFLARWRQMDEERREAEATSGGTGPRSRGERRQQQREQQQRGRGALASLGLDSYTSPFSALFASAGLTRSSSGGASRAAKRVAAAHAQGVATAAAAAASSSSSPEQRGAAPPTGGFGRAAQLFDAFGESPSSGGAGGGGGVGGMAAGLGAYYDPAERAALAARNLLRGFVGGGSGGGEGAYAAAGAKGDGRYSDSGGGGGGVGFSLSRGVGWLMGEDERAAEAAASAERRRG